MPISNEIFKEMTTYRVERLDPHDWMHWFMTFKNLSVYIENSLLIWQNNSIQSQKYSFMYKTNILI